MDADGPAKGGGPPLGVDDEAHLVLAASGLGDADGTAEQGVVQGGAGGLPAAQARLERVGRDGRRGGEGRGEVGVVGGGKGGAQGVLQGRD
jgi:hypothetical protein